MIRGRFNHNLVILCIGLIWIFVSIAHADCGDRSITVVCDFSQGKVSVTPFLMWNEELASFMEAHSNGIFRNGAVYTKVFETTDRKFNFTCKTKERVVKIRVKYNSSISQDVLEIIEGKRIVTEKVLDYIWFASGEKYRLESYKSKQWRECCGNEPSLAGEPVWCGPLTNSKTSNCEEVKSLWNNEAELDTAK
jgi:hypothetical protein